MKGKYLVMGKKKKNKQIAKAFKGWEEMTPEDQMRNADDFFNISKDNIDDILDLDGSKDSYIDNFAGIDPEVARDIANKYRKPEDVKEVEEPAEEIPEGSMINEDMNNFDEEEIPNDENDAETNYQEDTNDHESGSVTGDIIEKDDDYYIDVRKFGCIVRTTLGITTFDDGTAPFAINEHVAMLGGLAQDMPSVDLSAVIDLFKKALIVNRYPAALYTQEEFLNMLGKGTFKQLTGETAMFVDVLGTYIAVYFVREGSINRFNDTIKSIVSAEDADEYGDPYYNVWFYLASILNSDDHSFINDEGLVELFYNSNHNDKEIVKEYLNDKFIDRTSSDEDVVVNIIGRDRVESKYLSILSMILDDDEDNDMDTDDNDTPKEDAVEPTEEVEVITDQTDAEKALVAALENNAGISNTPSDGSMVIPVHHKEGKK